MEKIIVVGGPTASGKSKLAIAIAQKINGEIINGDSMQIYREMEIGTAKTTKKEQAGIPHHLMGFVSVKEDFSVADYQTLARAKITKIIEKGKVPIIIGGSGLYLKSVLYDYDFSEVKEREVSDKYDDFNDEELYTRLLQLDKEAATKTHPNNRKRVLRALEICENSGVSKTKLLVKQKHKPIYDCIFVGLTMDRNELYERINKRVDDMMANGLLQEAEHVLKLASINSTALQAIGYKEFVPYFKNEQTLEETIEEIKKNTRHFAKRQYTFFNNQFVVNWYNPEVQPMNKIVEDIEEIYHEGKQDERNI